MIVETIDQGWGQEHPLKKLEMAIVQDYLRTYRQDTSRTVVINSTWYDGDLNQRLLQHFSRAPPDRLVLVSMLDAAIARPDMFDDIPCEKRAIGYYAGQDYIDFWSLVVDQHMSWPSINLLDERGVDRAFMCLNRKPHWHRVQLVDAIERAGLIPHGLVSLGGEDGRARLLLAVDAGGSDLAPNGGLHQNGIANDIVTLGHPDNWRRHFLNIVTETQYDVTDTTFVTEKIYKPILGLRPFLVYAADGAVGWLRAQGFEPYTQDFHDICDLDLANPVHIVPFLSILVGQVPTYWQHKLVALREKIMHNRAQFDRHVHRTKTKITQGISCQI